jgi:hypothetical protein
MRLIPLRAFESGIGKKKTFLVNSDFAGDADLHAGHHHLRNELLIEPNTPDGPGLVGDGRFREEHSLPKGTAGLESPYGSADGRPFTGDEVADIPCDGIVFVSMREVEEEVTHAHNPELFQSDEIVGRDGGNGIEQGI